MEILDDVNTKRLIRLLGQQSASTRIIELSADLGVKSAKKFRTLYSPKDSDGNIATSERLRHSDVKILQSRQSLIEASLFAKLYRSYSVDEEYTKTVDTLSLITSYNQYKALRETIKENETNIDGKANPFEYSLMTINQAYVIAKSMHLTVHPSGLVYCKKCDLEYYALGDDISCNRQKCPYCTKRKLRTPNKTKVHSVFN